MKKELFSNIYPMCYRVLMATLLSGAVVNCAGYWLGISQGSVWNRIVMIGVLISVACLNYGKAIWKLVSAIVPVFGVTIMIPLISAGKIGDFWGNYFGWLIGMAGYEKEWVTGYGLIQTIWVVLACYVSQIIIEKKQIFRDIVAGLLCVGLPICMLFKIQIGHEGVVFATAYIFVVLVQRIRVHWDKKKERDSREYVMFLVPFIAIYVIALICIKPNPEPFEWKLVKTVYNQISENIIIWRENANRGDSEDFGLATVGFSDNGDLAGRIEQKDKTLMTVRGDSSVIVNNYMRGKAYDTFNGREWKKTVSEDLTEYPMDTFEMMYALERYDRENIRNYMRAANLTVRYEYFNTGYLFAPNKVIGIRDMECEWNAGDAVFGEQRGYGTEYGVFYYQLNLNTPEFATFLETEQEEDVGVWNNIMATKHSLISNQYSLEDLERYRASMQERYYEKLTLSEQTRSYLEEVTAGCETPLQKLKAIEEELAGYNYTTSPGELPKKVKSQEAFLDYFLLQSKQGFCTHFASAFVLLARAEGFPARYVEGFCVPLTDDSVMNVSSDMGHAWPEVYLEGIGWIPFEPTPGYGEYRYHGWQQVNTDAEMTEEDDSITEADMQEEEARLQEELEEKKQKRKQRMALILQGMALILIICAMMIIAEKILTKKRYKRMSAERKFLVEVRRNLWILARFGYRRTESETLNELQERIRKSRPHWFEKKKEFVFLKAYEEHLYRDSEVSDKLLREIREETTELLALIKAENKWTYYVVRVALWLRMSM